MKFSGRIIKNLRDFSYIAKKDGLSSGFYWLLYDVINRLTPFSVYKIMTLALHDIDPEYLKYRDDFRYVFLDENQIRKFCDEPDNDMTKRFVDEALGNGDECLGVLDGDKLVSYAWYSYKPSQVIGDAYFYYNDDYKYRQKAFTNINYRGKRLNVKNKAKACEYFTERGYKGLISLVEAHNFSSLRSNNKNRTFTNGRIYMIMLFNKILYFTDRKAKKMGCYFAPKKQ